MNSFTSRSSVVSSPTCPPQSYNPPSNIDVPILNPQQLQLDPAEISSPKDNPTTSSGASGMDTSGDNFGGIDTADTVHVSKHGDFSTTSTSAFDGTKFSCAPTSPPQSPKRRNSSLQSCVHSRNTDTKCDVSGMDTSGDSSGMDTSGGSVADMDTSDDVGGMDTSGSNSASATEAMPLADAVKTEDVNIEEKLNFRVQEDKDALSEDSRSTTSALSTANTVTSYDASATDRSALDRMSFDMTPPTATTTVKPLDFRAAENSDGQVTKLATDPAGASCLPPAVSTNSSNISQRVWPNTPLTTSSSTAAAAGLHFEDSRTGSGGLYSITTATGGCVPTGGEVSSEVNTGPLRKSLADVGGSDEAAADPSTIPSITSRAITNPTSTSTPLTTSASTTATADSIPPSLSTTTTTTKANTTTGSTSGLLVGPEAAAAASTSNHYRNPVLTNGSAQRSTAAAAASGALNGPMQQTAATGGTTASQQMGCYSLDSFKLQTTHIMQHYILQQQLMLHQLVASITEHPCVSLQELQHTIRVQYRIVRQQSVHQCLLAQQLERLLERLESFAIWGRSLSAFNSYDASANGGPVPTNAGAPTAPGFDNLGCYGYGRWGEHATSAPSRLQGSHVQTMTGAGAAPHNTAPAGYVQQHHPQPQPQQQPQSGSSSSSGIVCSNTTGSSSTGIGNQTPTLPQQPNVGGDGTAGCSEDGVTEMSSVHNGVGNGSTFCISRKRLNTWMATAQWPKTEGQSATSAADMSTTDIAAKSVSGGTGTSCGAEGALPPSDVSHDIHNKTFVRACSSKLVSRPPLVESTTTNKAVYMTRSKSTEVGQQSEISAAAGADSGLRGPGGVVGQEDEVVGSEDYVNHSNSVHIIKSDADSHALHSRLAVGRTVRQSVQESNTNAVTIDQSLPSRLLENDSTVKRTRKANRNSMANMTHRCSLCSSNLTPQWRYLDSRRFCNACYMRIKRHLATKGMTLNGLVRHELSSSIDSNLPSGMVASLAKSSDSSLVKESKASKRSRTSTTDLASPTTTVAAGPMRDASEESHTGAMTADDSNSHSDDDDSPTKGNINMCTPRNINLNLDVKMDIDDINLPG